MSYQGKCAAPKAAAGEPRERPGWLRALDGLCRPCADAEFYGLRMQHANCERGDCACTYEIPDAWPAGTWPVRVPASA